MAKNPRDEIVHASCVAWHDHAVLICGSSGSGKSALALEMLALGCTLVGDDQVQLRSIGEGLWASAAPNLKGLIEARGLGILKADTKAGAWVRLAVDLDRASDARLPERLVQRFCGVDIDLVHKSERTHFAAAILQYMKGGRYG